MKEFSLKAMSFLGRALNCMISNSRRCLKQVSNIGILSFITFTYYVLLCNHFSFWWVFLVVVFFLLLCLVFLLCFFCLFFQRQKIHVLYFPLTQLEVPAYSLILGNLLCLCTSL